MLKIKDNVDLKELEKFGFKYKYSEENGEIKEIYSIKSIRGIRHILKFIKIKTLLGNNNIKFYKTKEGYVLNDFIKSYSKEDIGWFDFDTLHDLIKADLVEKVEE